MVELFQVLGSYPVEAEQAASQLLESHQVLGMQHSHRVLVCWYDPETNSAIVLFDSKEPPTTATQSSKLGLAAHSDMHFLKQVPLLLSKLKMTADEQMSIRKTHKGVQRPQNSVQISRGLPRQKERQSTTP